MEKCYLIRLAEHPKTGKTDVFWTGYDWSVCGDAYQYEFLSDAVAVIRRLRKHNPHWKQASVLTLEKVWQRSDLIAVW